MYEKVTAIAAEKGLSIYKLEQIAGVANGTIGRWKDGKGTTINSIVKIAKALDVSVDYLLGIDEERGN